MRFKRAMAASMAAVMAVSSAVVCQITASAAEPISIDKLASAPADDMETVLYTGVIDGQSTFTNENEDGGKLTFNSVDSSIMDKDNVYVKLVVSGLGAVGDNQWSSILSWGFNNYSWANVIHFYNNYNGEFDTLFIPTEDGNESRACCYVKISNFAISQWGTIQGNIQSGNTKGVTLESAEIVEVAFGKAMILSDESKTFDSSWVSSIMISKSKLITKPGKIVVTVSGVGENAQCALKTDADGWPDLEIKDISADATEVSFDISEDIISEKFQVNRLIVSGQNYTVEKVEYIPTIEVSSLTIDGDEERTATYGDADVTLTVAPNPDANTYDESKVTWKSSDEKVATVSEDGTVSFVGAGSATITATYDNDSAISDSVTFTVAKKAVTATITAKDVTDATVNEALAMAKAAATVNTTLDKADYKLTVKLAEDKKSYTASVALTDEAAKKFTLTCADAKGNIAYKVTDLILSSDTLTIPITSEGVQLTATIQPEGLAEGEIIWNVKDNTVATYEDGMVKPVSGSAGNSTIITATVKDTDVKATCKVTIAEVLNPAADITLDKTELSGTAGEKATLKATVVGEDSTKDSTDVVTWKSSDEKVATVTAGNVTFVGAGTATITATAGEKSATCTVTVKAATVAVEKITLDKTTAEITVGDTTTLKTTVTPDNATDKTVTWTSSDETVATVKDGVVTAVKAGTATITAKAGDKTATCTVTVKAKEEKPDPTPAANEKEIWTGSTDLGTDWSKSVTVPKADVKIGDTIRIKVGTGSAEYHQIKIMDSNWEVLSSVKSKADAQYGTITVDKDGYVDFVVNAADAKLISEGGLIISGYDLTISSVSNKALKDETYAPSTKVHTVVKNGTSMIAVFAISEEDAAKYDSYTVTITRGSDNKSTYIVIDNCYKYVTYTKDNEDIRVSGDGAYYIMLNITGIESSFGGITIRIDPTVPKG